MIPGAPAADAPVTGPSGDWLLGYLGGDFTLLGFGAAVPPSDVAALGARPDPVPGRADRSAGRMRARRRSWIARGSPRRRYDARPGTVYLLRPDQHVCARWRHFDPSAVRAAIARATGNG